MTAPLGRRFVSQNTNSKVSLLSMESNGLMGMDRAGFRHPVCTCSSYLKRRRCDHLEDLYHANYPEDLPRGQVAVLIWKEPELYLRTLILPIDDDKKITLCTVTVIAGVQGVSKNSIDMNFSEMVGVIDRTRDGYRDLRRLVIPWLLSLPTRAFQEDWRCFDKAHVGTHLLGWYQWDEPLSTYETVSDRRVVIDAYQILDSKMCDDCVTFYAGSSEDPGLF